MTGTRLRRALAALATAALLTGAGEGCGQGPYSPIRDKPEKVQGGNERGGGDAHCRRLKQAADDAPVLDRAAEMRKYREECL